MENASKNLRNATFSGVVWRTGERICAQAVSFVVSLVLARLLLPDDYGIIVLANIFIAIADVLFSHGLGTALVQNPETSDKEMSL